MASSYGLYQGDGTQTDFATPQYIAKTHITVYVNGASVSFSFLSANVARVSPAPANGAWVLVRRHTPDDPLVVHSDSEIIYGDDLNLAERQALYRAIEADEWAHRGIGIDEATLQLDAGNHRIIRVSNPINGTDAANKQYVDGVYPALVAIAEAAADAAGLSAASASDDASDAASAAADAAEDAAEALEQANRAQGYADEFEAVINPISREFSTRAAAVAATIPVAITKVLHLLGYSALNDGGDATYKWVASQPSHPGKLQTADGAWWELLPTPFVTVRQFGAKGDGGTDDRAAFNNAALCASALGPKKVLVPATSSAYIVSDVVNVPTSVAFEGDGAGSRVYTSNASAHTFSLDGGGCAIRYMIMATTGVTKTDGAHIYIPSTGSGAMIEHCNLYNGLYGIRLNGAIGVKVSHTNILNSTSDGVFLEGTSLATEITNSTIQGSGASTRSGILVVHAGDLTMSNLQILGNQYGLYALINSGFGGASFKANQVFFDSNTINGMYIKVNGTGGFARSTFDACEWTSSGAAGIRLETSSGGTIDGLYLTNPMINLNGADGVQIIDSGVKNFSSIGGMCSHNVGAGFSIASNVKKFRIEGMKIGPSGNLNGNAYPVLIASGADDFVIMGNDMQGNTNPYFNGSSGSNKIDGTTFNLQ